MSFIKLSLSLTLAVGLLLGLGVLVTLQPAQAAPTATIQALIDAAPNGGTVNIAAGTYTESLTVNKSLTLTGVASNTTILQAVTGQRTITVTTGNNLRLEHLTVTGGQAPVGGGVWLMSGTLTLMDCRIVSNTANYGGGIFQEGETGRVEVIDSLIEGNTTSNHGGGLYVSGSAAFTNTQVLSNTATFHGGGVHVNSGWGTVTGGVWRANRAGENGGAINLNGALTLSGTVIISNTAKNGGGVQQWNTTPTILITNTRFERNTASHIGGGAAISGTLIITSSTFMTNTADSGSSSDTFGGGLFAYTATKIFASTFSGNSALCLYGGSCSHADGGGLYDDGSNVALTDVVFQSNQAGRMGGGLASDNSSPVLFNVIFRGNKAGWGGGFSHQVGSPWLVNVLFTGNMGGWAGGMLADRDTPTLKHVTFSGNNGYNQGGALLNANAAPTVINSIMWGNTATYGPEIYNTSATPVITITYSDIKFTGVYTGAGNINADPHFVRPITYTSAPTTTGDYHLQPDSPAIDQGNFAGVMVDLEGRPRPIGPGYDLGAYEAPLPTLLAGNNSPTSVGSATSFTATIINGLGFNFTWNFGDSLAGSGANTSHTYASAGHYVATVTATNGSLILSVTLPVTITNLPPQAITGSNQTVPPNSVVTLSGNASTDPDGHLPLTYQWRQTGGSSVALASNTLSVTTFTAPAAADILTFTLTITDAYGLASAPATTVVKIVTNVYLPVILR